MKRNTIIISVIAILGFSSVTLAALSNGSNNVLLDDNRVAANHGASCVTNVTNASPVGNQLSSTILAASSSRAYARLQRVTDATGLATSGPVYISFDEGAAATVGTGLALSTTTPFLEFGLNTSHPYVNAVTAITTSGSTTILTTVCTY